jgi:hypothetical protein
LHDGFDPIFDEEPFVKYSIIASAVLSSIVAATGAADSTSVDPLTKLPLPHAVGSLQVGGSPMSLPAVPVCKSAGQMNFYTGVKGKVNAAIDWYASNLQGFQRVHGYGSGRSQDTFYNAPGTLIVSITGDPAAEGRNTDVYSIIYGTIKPGVSAAVIAGMNIQKVVCP